MILLTERIEEVLKGLLQKRIQLTVRDKKIGAGKLILYRIDGFYIELTIQEDVLYSVIEIPYPFNTIIQNSSITQFDYRLETLSEKDHALLASLQSMTKKRDSKFYNALVNITQI